MSKIPDQSNIPDKYLSPYNPHNTEAEIYRTWEESGFFNPDICIEKGITKPDAETFSMVLPPPNVTGMLHMGSAFMLVIEDILARHARMRGKRTLWLPGADSAAIATQAKVEKDIYKKENLSRHDLGREELLRRIDTFVEENKTTILEQIRSFGSSLDWSRYKYTMDDDHYRAVMTAFVRMYEAGLIYRDNRIVNWDPKGQTTISDDEIEHEERDAVLYTFRYWEEFPISISTTRPETKVGDTAVAVHPNDKRYQSFIGREFTGEFAGKTLTIRVVADDSVDPDFGTGALGVTPAHSHTDWDISLKHGLSKPQVINELTKMTEEAGPLVSGMKTTAAREKIVEWLRTNGLLESEEDIKQNISVAQRTGGIVEPLPKLQWFVDVNKTFKLNNSSLQTIYAGSETTLKEIMRKTVQSGEIKILPERFEKVYYHWIDNLRDWCISRQIWFGHRIPIWYRSTGAHNGQGEEIHCGLENPEGEGWKQDPDVLDTWFSSALWTFSTLGWPKDTPDLKTYHPTDVIESGYDILFFWMARMILMSGFHLGQIPFRTIYLHGLVRDEKGRKLSKSLGNNIDPMEVSKKYGTDAVRMSLIVGAAPGADSRMSDDKLRAYKKFGNKIWNITRFVLSNLSSDFNYHAKPKEITEENIRQLKRLNELTEEISTNITNFNIHLASEKLYQYIWHEFADIILEEAKPALSEGTEEEKRSTEWTLMHILKTSMKLLHPFMPFITEEIWRDIKTPEENLLMVESWPV